MVLLCLLSKSIDLNGVTDELRWSLPQSSPLCHLVQRPSKVEESLSHVYLYSESFEIGTNLTFSVTVAQIEVTFRTSQALIPWKISMRGGLIVIVHIEERVCKTRAFKSSAQERTQAVAVIL